MGTLPTQLDRSVYICRSIHVIIIYPLTQIEFKTCELSTTIKHKTHRHTRTCTQMKSYFRSDVSFVDINSQFSKCVFKISVGQECVEVTFNEDQSQTIVHGFTLKHVEEPEERKAKVTV